VACRWRRGRSSSGIRSSEGYFDLATKYHQLLSGGWKNVMTIVIVLVACI